MQQKASVVIPASPKLQQPYQSYRFLWDEASSEGGSSQNFSKPTFSSRSKAVNAAFIQPSTRTVKIGNAEAKPVTRNRPRAATSPEAENSKHSKSKVKTSIDKPPERTKSLLKKPEKRYDSPERPQRVKTQISVSAEAQKPAKNINENVLKPKLNAQNSKPIHQQSSKTPQPVTIRILDGSRKDVPITSVKVKLATERPKLKLTKTINNNDIWPSDNAKLPHFGAKTSLRSNGHERDAGPVRYMTMGELADGLATPNPLGHRGSLKNPSPAIVNKRSRFCKTPHASHRFHSESNPASSRRSLTCDVATESGLSFDSGAGLDHARSGNHSVDFMLILFRTRTHCRPRYRSGYWFQIESRFRC
ncbi:hypothetical protein EVAR_94881_1 [Eumeta japonica]|uniref:Uncharacterized protein n=1 Tax=Eumeta variegata TaxID=151549 RepID=A0A4C1VA32_EUMVA|nr:hypothetical protein EVAR_94881_1 [Eumeta japonica]